MIDLAKVAFGFCVALAFSCVMIDDGRLRGAGRAAAVAL
jgi:hypothetical protein